MTDFWGGIVVSKRAGDCGDSSRRSESSLRSFFSISFYKKSKFFKNQFFEFFAQKSTNLG